MSQYLSRYAEIECGAIDSLFQASRDQFSEVIVIPAYDEALDFVERLNLFDQKLLLILVVNQPTGSEESQRNRLLFDTLLASDTSYRQHLNVYRLVYKTLSIVLIDRFSPNRQIPAHQGVGLARKIGADLAAQCIARGIVNSAWIYSTDADAHLPKNYFSGETHHDTSAKVFEFRHKNDGSDIAKATATYEQALRYYVSGLRFAGSPYAFYTLGSILAIKSKAYCQVRGFPKRSGGEDFYLLNKLAKVGKIHLEPTVSVSLTSRLSDRVPFGTGPAVAKILETMSSDQQYHYYNPKIFELLKDCLAWIDEELFPLLESLDRDSNTINHYLPKQSVDAIYAVGFAKFVNHAVEQCGTKKIFIEQFHSWFDAFRTLKFIHHMQAHDYPALPLEDCLNMSAHWKTEKEK